MSGSWSCRSDCMKRISMCVGAMLLSCLTHCLLADVTTAPGEWMTSRCPEHCSCYFASSGLQSTLPLRTVNCSDIVFSSTKFHLPQRTESLVVTGSAVDLPILTAVLFRDGNQLRQLVLSRIDLHSFDGLAAPETLRCVIASHNELVSLPDATFVRFASLQTLDLSHNRLEVIHRYAFVGLGRLRQLDLSRNHLSGAFEGLRWVCELGRLELLNLSHNGIHVLDDMTFACSKHPPPMPRRWSVHHNTTTSSVANGNTHLQLLDLGFNRIRHIHSRAFISLGHIDQIRLNDNLLLGLPVHAIQLSVDVLVWELSGNEMEVLQSGSFIDNQRIEEVRLNGMRRLRIIDDAAFVNVTSLQRVQLSHNRHLRYISRSAFVNVPALTSLVLVDSGLYTLEPQVVDSLPALGQLALTGNPLACDCTVRSLFQRLQNISTDIGEHAVCSNYSDSVTLQISPLLSQDNSDVFSGDVDASNRSSHITDVQATRNSTTHVVLSSTAIKSVDQSAALEQSSVGTVSSGCSPRILALFDDELHVTVTDRLRVDCRAVGFPVPTVKWLLPVNHAIEQAGNDHIHVTKSHRTQVALDNGTLLIDAVAMHNHGNYTCIADNGGNDSDRRSVYVHVKWPGTSLIVLHVTSSSVTVTWRGLHSSREYRVRYRENWRDQNASVGQVLVKPYMRSFTASHLKPEMTYSFCIDVRQATFVSRFHAIHRGRFVAVDCSDITTRHSRYARPLVRSLAVHVLIGASVAIASLGLLLAVSSIVTRRYDRRKLRQAALHSVSVSSGGVLIQRDDDLPTGNGNATSSFETAASAGSVTFENRAASVGDSDTADGADLVAMFDSDDLDEIRSTAIMQRI